MASILSSNANLFCLAAAKKVNSSEKLIIQFSGFESSCLVTFLQYSTEGSADVWFTLTRTICPIGVSFQAGHSSLKSTADL
nr:hypothetical transcript [Hymenolepis microstoma]